jgi:hypothetical protein
MVKWYVKVAVSGFAMAALVYGQTHMNEYITNGSFTTKLMAPWTMTSVIGTIDTSSLDYNSAPACAKIKPAVYDSTGGTARFTNNPTTRPPKNDTCELTFWVMTTAASGW